MSEQVLISVVVPVFNSEGIVSELAFRLHSTLQALCGERYEVIFVDDCSTDGVWKKIKELASAHPNVRGIRLGKNSGQWMAVLAGCSQASGKYIVTIDDDLEYDPADIEKLYRAINTGDIYLVFGIAPEKYRKKNMNELSTLLRNRFINLFWHKFLTDSFKIFRRELLFNGKHFAPKIHFEAFIKHSLDERFAGYVEVKYNKRFAGDSNHTLWKKFCIFLRYSIEYHPAPAFGIGILAFLFYGICILLGHFVFNGLFPDWDGAVSGFFILILALLILHYVSIIYRAVRQIPDYWIIETTENPK